MISGLVASQTGWRRGLGRALVREALARAGGLRIDLLGRSGSYYLSLRSRVRSGIPTHKEAMA